MRQHFFFLFLFCKAISEGSANWFNENGEFESSLSTKSVVDEILKETPIIDTHNDLPWNYRHLAMNQLKAADFSEDLKGHPFWYKSNMTHTDLPRMKKSGFGGQFWSVYTNCEASMKDAVEQSLEQIDFVKRFTQKYKDHLLWATSVKDIDEAHKQGKIASLIGVEGGHNIQSNYGILRMFYELGVRYLTLTHVCNTPWADSSPVDVDPTDPDFILAEHHGLTSWGIGLVIEMNRLGMMVDISHTSEATQIDVLKVSRAPVMFSHSGVKGIHNHHRNVGPAVLELVKKTGSVICLNLYAEHLKNKNENATIDDAIAHAEHIRKVVGINHICIGADYDGVKRLPKGLEDAGKLRNLLEALYETGTWSKEDLGKFANKNIKRVFKDVEQIRDSLKDWEEPNEQVLAVPNYLSHPGITAKFY